MLEDPAGRRPRWSRSTSAASAATCPNAIRDDARSSDTAWAAIGSSWPARTRTAARSSATNLLTMYLLDDEQSAADRRLRRDARRRDRRGRRPGRRRARRRPRLAWGPGGADFAVNRRNNKEAGRPRLRERIELAGPGRSRRAGAERPRRRREAAGGRLRLRLPRTVLSFYQWCGDYAGLRPDRAGEGAPRRDGHVLGRLRRRPEPAAAPHGRAGREVRQAARRRRRARPRRADEAGRRPAGSRRTRRSTWPFADAADPRAAGEATRSRATATSPAGASCSWSSSTRRAALPPTYPVPGPGLAARRRPDLGLPRRRGGRRLRAAAEEEPRPVARPGSRPTPTT